MLVYVTRPSLIVQNGVLQNVVILAVDGAVGTDSELIFCCSNADIFVGVREQFWCLNFFKKRFASFMSFLFFTSNILIDSNWFVKIFYPSNMLKVLFDSC